MTQHVPYTRRAVQLIRNGACARDLGWPESTYDNVCRSRGIAREKPHTEPVKRPGKPAHELDFRRSGEVIRASIIVSLPEMQAKAFKPLYERFIRHDDSFMPGADLAEMISATGTQPRVAGAVHRLNIRLAALRCCIESKGGHNGGYRLRVDT